MKVQELQEIVKLMENSGIAELSLEEENLKLSLKRECKTPEVVTVAQPMVASLPAEAHLPTAPVAPAPKEDKNIFVIKSPMVGTFYASPSPDSAPYVTEGTQVSAETVVCILEAMKVMNEVRADCSGKIVEILAKNGTAVEYGQPLFKVQL
jgi:acetyl-CoA carboxylase, biotin carboxyl carrier protein